VKHHRKMAVLNTALSLLWVVIAALNFCGGKPVLACLNLACAVTWAGMAWLQHKTYKNLAQLQALSQLMNARMPDPSRKPAPPPRPKPVVLPPPKPLDF